MAIARRLCVLIILWSAVWATGAVAAHAGGAEGCQSLKGTLRISPGLTDVPTTQTVTFAARLAGCPFAGGSGIVGATTQTAPVTCATLTGALAPTTGNFAWADGTLSTVALTFVSVPGSPNRLDANGTLISGTERGDRISEALHLRATVTRTVRQAFHRQQIPPTRHLEHQPLNSGAGDCVGTAPVETINVASSQSLALTAPYLRAATPTAKHPKSAQTNLTAAHARTAAAAAAASAVRSSRAAARAAPQAAALSRTSRRSRPRQTSLTPVAVGGPSGPTSGNGYLNPATVLFAIFLGSSACLFAFLLKPAWLMRLLRRVP